MSNFGAPKSCVHLPFSTTITTLFTLMHLKDAAGVGEGHAAVADKDIEVCLVH